MCTKDIKKGIVREIYYYLTQTRLILNQKSFNFRFVNFIRICDKTC